jgi:ribosome-binding factor A
VALSHRTERIAEQIREEIGQMLATEVSDPGVGLVTITRVKVTADLSLARVYWTIIGDAAERTKTNKALKRAVPYLRHLLASRMTLRRVPELQMHFDESVAAQDRIERILQDLHREEGEKAGAAPACAPENSERAPAGKPDAPDAPAPPGSPAPENDRS